jgi:hypothetical protein
MAKAQINRLMMMVLLLAVAEAACIEAVCGTLASAYCAYQVSEDVLSVNSEGCSGSCSVEDIEYLSVGSYIECASQAMQEISYSFSFSYSFDSTKLQSEYSWSWSYEISSTQCGVRQPIKELREGDYPKLCDSDFDCMLEDGTSASCSCSLDGSSYCVADFNSEMYNDFWNECDDDDLDQVESQYWYSVMSTYPLYVNVVECAMATFNEFRIISEFESDAAITLGLMGLLVIS